MLTNEDDGVMIRRKKDILGDDLPVKTREKTIIDTDQNFRPEINSHVRLVHQCGRGNLAEIYRQHAELGNQSLVKDELDLVGLLNRLYKLSGQAKVKCIANMLKAWLADPKNGKLCIFAHHKDVLDTIACDAGLSNELGSTTKFIRIDGSTKRRDVLIDQFQNDPNVRVALLGITAAGVGITLHASSTVWFAELFWTPAALTQAEDRW